MRQDDFDQAKQTALRFLEVRMRTAQEVTQQLQKKGYGEDVVKATIVFLEEYRYLDDWAYCRAWIHDRLQFHPCGRQKLAFDLSKKVADRQMVQKSLAEYYPEAMELELAVGAAQKKISSSRAVNRAQLGRFLYNKGYSGAVVERILQMDKIQVQLHNVQNDVDF